MSILIQSNESSEPKCRVSQRPQVRKERLRVLHVVPRLGLGGTEHGVLKVLRGLGDEDFEHRLCAVRGMDEDFLSRMKVMSKTCSAGTGRRGFQFPLFRLARIMREFSPHIVHTRNFGALEAIPAARLAKVPVTVHSEHGYELEILSGLPLRRRLACRTMYSMANVVFTVTNDLRAFHGRQAWLEADDFRVIYNGVDTDRFAPRPGDAARLRLEFAIPQDRVVIGSVGRLVPIKDHPTLLRAAEKLLRAGRNVHVLVAGAGPDLEKLKRQVAASEVLRERVTFVGATDCVPEVLNAMDVFVLPSICEGMSNTILEAMASGLPVVATSAGGNPELVENGQSGLLFSPSCVESLTQHLIRLTDDSELRMQLGQEARQRAVNLFSLSGMIQHYRDLYLELTAQRVNRGKENK